MRDIPKLLTIGQRTMLPKIGDLWDNQMAILEWLFSLGHEIDDGEFAELMVEDQYEYSSRGQ